MRRFAALVLLLLPLAPNARAQALSVEQLKKIKAATLYIKVSVGEGGGTGSGFVVHAAKDYGLVVTNHHVVAPHEWHPERFPAAAKPEVEAVFNSGRTDEWVSPAEVLYANKADDLALLKVKAVKPLPAPLTLTTGDPVPETTGVFVCGFPFGEDLAEGQKNPEISIGPASVSSNRTDDAGQVSSVQLNGSLNPGNSGGPVVTADGKLVGVAVSTIRGTGIVFAVPPHKVHRIVRGVHFVDLAPRWVDAQPPRVRVEAKFLDALGRLKTLTAHVAPAPAAGKVSDADDVSKRAGVQTVAATIDTATGTVAVEFPPAAAPQFLLQFAWTDPDGRTDRAPPILVPTSAVVQPFKRTTTGPVKFVTKLPPTPPGQLDLEALATTGAAALNQRLTVDALTKGSADGKNGSPVLDCHDAAGQSPQNIEFQIGRDLAAEFTPAALGRQSVAVRLTGALRQPSGRGGKLIFGVDQLDVLDAAGAEVATFARAGVVPPKAATPIVEPLLPREPSPFGSDKAQAAAHARLLKQSPESLGKRFSYAGEFRSRGTAALTNEGRPVAAVLLNFVTPDGLQLIDGLLLYASTEMADELGTHLADQKPSGRLPCVFEFEVVRYNASLPQNHRIECRVHSVSFVSVRDRSNRITVDNPPPAFGPNPTAPASPEPPKSVQPDAPQAKPENPLAQPPAAVPATPPALKVESSGGGLPAWLIAALVTGGLLILAGVVVSLRGSSQSSSAKATARGRRKPTQPEDDEDWHDRPRKRPSRRN